MKNILRVLVLCLAAATAALASPAAEDLIKLARSGVDGEVLLAYVETSAVPFDLTVEDIITLKDLGVPAGVINAALHRGQVLDSAAAAPGAVVPAPAPAPAAQTAPPQGDLNISFFYDVLAPYGRWIMLDGDWCWQPTAAMVSIEWSPYYSHGRWVYTDWGWCWVSDYSWGWAPFHYGRWFRHHRYGWVWWPDYEWGPAWVAWRYGGGYWGWAPLPRHIRYDHHSQWFYRGKKRLPRGYTFELTVNDFFFVRLEHLADPKPWVHIIPPRRAADIYKKTTFDPQGFGGRDGKIYNRGPDAGDVARASKKPVVPLNIIPKELKPGQPITGGRTLPNGLEIYSPKIEPKTPRPPAVAPDNRGGLSEDILKRRQEAADQALDRKKAEAEAAERERKALIDSAKKENDRTKKGELSDEARIREQRARQAKDKMERIQKWVPVPATPAPQSRDSKVREEARKQVQSEAMEEQDKQKALEDLLRKPPAEKKKAKGSKGDQ
jgi:hypothetical protein